MEDTHLLQASVSLVCFLVFSMLIPAGAVTLPFEDGFENIAVGDYPNENGWSVLTSGRTALVSDVHAASGSRSFRLEGHAGWSRCDYVQLDRSDIELGVTYEVSVYLPDAPQEGALIGFAQLHGNMLPHYNSFCFSNAGTMGFSGIAPGVTFGDWEPNRWYRIRVKIDYTQLQADVYIDGTLVGENLPTRPIEFTDGFGHNVLDKFVLTTPNWSPPTPAVDVAYFDDVRILAGPSVIEATVDLNPDTLNLKSKGKRVTCYVELPEGYSVGDIDVSTVLLDGVVPAESHPTGIGDHDGDGTPDLMVKFDRQTLIGYLYFLGVEDGQDVELAVTGELRDETEFEGADTIHVIEPGR